MFADLETTLTQIRDSLQRITPGGSPPVVVINQIPGSGNSWTPESGDHTVVGVSVAFILMLLGVAGLLIVRRFKPVIWERWCGNTKRALRRLALPASWLCGVASSLLRRFSTDPAVSVWHLLFAVDSLYRFDYPIPSEGLDNHFFCCQSLNYLNRFLCFVLH